MSEPDAVRKVLASRFQRRTGASDGPNAISYSAPCATGYGVNDHNRTALRAIGLPFLDFDLQAATVIEIVGPHSAGKTIVLYHVAACALAHAQAPHRANVIWIGLNGLPRMHILNNALRPLCPDGVTEKSFISDCLSRLHVYAPSSTISLLCTLHSLSDFLRTSQGQQVRVLIIDALGMYHYVDAIRPDVVRRGLAEVDDIEQALVAVLRRLLQTFEILCYVSKCPLFDSPTSQGIVSWPFDEKHRPPLFLEFMPQTWSNLAPYFVVVYGEPGSRRAALASRRKTQVQGKASSGTVYMAFCKFEISDNGVAFAEACLAPAHPSFKS